LSGGKTFAEASARVVGLKRFVHKAALK